ncbi:uncharacterized protein [Amphiura filiformis]|uniref:uncharacterized protein n=1 Tax=Amphiura filiformis TaxID=82378 RepID=UPI003B219518
MNILAWLLYIKALVCLLQPVSSMAMWGRLCGKPLADMVALVCDGRYYTGQTDSPLLSERQAKSFTSNGGRKRTGKIVTECCDKHCNLQIIESYCAPLPEGQTRTQLRHWFLHEKEKESANEENNTVEELPPPPPPRSEERDEEQVPDVSQDLTFSDHDWEDSIESETLNEAIVMLADAPLTEQNTEEELLHKKDIKSGTNTTMATQDEAREEDVILSESSDRTKGKGNRTHRPTHRPSSERKSRRRNSKEKKRNKSREKKNREGKKKNKSKNKKNRRRKNRHGEDDFTQPTDELITDIEVMHPQARVVSRSEPVHAVDDPTDPGSRSERSFLTTITAKLLDVIGLQQNSNHDRRR